VDELDLRLRPGPGVPGGLVVPHADLEERFSRSSGPGGQSVNTTDSRVELLLDLTRTGALSESQRRRAIDRVGPVIGVVASERRSQHRNRVAARERLAEHLRAALAPPALPRVPTKPTRGSQRRRVESKRRRSQLKSMRGRVRPD
jgi:ribosome-associated protein